MNANRRKQTFVIFRQLDALSAGLQINRDINNSLDACLGFPISLARLQDEDGDGIIFRRLQCPIKRFEGVAFARRSAMR